MPEGEEGRVEERERERNTIPPIAVEEVVVGCCHCLAFCHCSLYDVIVCRSVSHFFSQTKVRLEICGEVPRHSEGSLPIMQQPKCPDVWHPAGCHFDR